MKLNDVVSVDGVLYFAETDGAIKKNGWTSNNQYYAGSDGKLLTNTTTPDGLRVDSIGRRVQVVVSQPVQQTSGGGSTSGGGGGNSSSYNNTGNVGNTGVGVTTGAVSSSSIQEGNVVWGDHLRYTQTVYLDEYGEDGGVGKISINVTKLKVDGSTVVNDVNTVLQQIYDEACDRAQFELPFKTFELEKTALSTSNATQLIIVVTGSIKHMDNTNENMRYKLTLDKEHGNVSYEKVR